VIYPEALAFGIVDAPSPAGDAALAAKLRDLTATWSRYDYRGRILEASTVDDLLDQALDLGYRWCLVQATGHVILERWDEGRRRLAEYVADWVVGDDFLVLGALIGDGCRLDDACLLVDVGRWAGLGRPRFGPSAGRSLVETSLRHGLPVRDIGPILEGRRVVLGSLPAPEAARLSRYLGQGIGGYDGESWSDPHVDRFLRDVQRQVVDATRGVFLWNLEPYDDVRTPPDGFEAPISTLYSVASGLKPNVILESLGFDDRTRVVFFDYSANALKVKRVLLERWDGRDFPAFVRSLFRMLPSSRAYYQLPSGASPETLEPSVLDAAWARELDAWGGDRAFEEHWSRYRRLRHEFVRCDLLRSAAPLLARVRPEEDAVIWWSNAFFSVHGNWLYDAASRRRAYERWIDALAEQNADLFLYGSDFRSSSVNDIRAGRYRTVLREANGEELVPLAAAASEIRF
jgi:hypothetical protein